jgi:hypothetical protein
MSRRAGRTAQDLLSQILALLGPGIRLLHAHEREWASITFTGARHRFVLEIPESAMIQPAILRALTGLPDHEFNLRGEIVADCTYTIGMPLPGVPSPVPPALPSAGERLLVVELLTVIAD